MDSSVLDSSVLDSSVFAQPQFLLSAAITCAGGLAQQVLTDPTIPGILAFAAHQLAKATLRSHHALPGRLLEQTSGNVFNVAVFTQVRTVQQPLRHAHGKALGRDNSLGCRGRRNWG